MNSYMQYKDFYKTELFENSDYLGNCVDLPDQFESDDQDAYYAVEWMKSVLGDNDNVIRIPEETFYKYIEPSEIPKRGLKGTDKECYFIKNGRGHPTGHIVNFCFYSTTKNGDDIHYFFDYRGSVNISDLISVKLENGNGVGENMTES